MGERLGLIVWDGKEKAFFYSHWGGTDLSFVSIVAEGVIFGKATDTRSFAKAMEPYRNEIKPIERLYGMDIEYFGIIDFTRGIATKTGLIDYDARDEFAKELEAAPRLATWDLLSAIYQDFEYGSAIRVSLEPMEIVEKFGEIVLSRIERIEREWKGRIPPLYQQIVSGWLNRYAKLVKAAGKPPIHEKVIEKAGELLGRCVQGV